MPVCEILSVGTELLLGEILNTNAQFLSVELADLGISVLRQSTVGDNPRRLASAVKEALERSDILITTGGLGPTADDITKEVCCETLGVKLKTDAEILKQLEDYFLNRGTSMPESNKKQALVPESGTIFPNKNGTAPGFALEKDGKCIIMLPGPPREIRPMFLEYVKPFLSKHSDGIIITHTVRTFGIGESAMAELAGNYLSGDNPTVAPYAKDGEAMLRIGARGKTRAEAEALCAPVLKELLEVLGDFVYGVDSQSLQESVVNLLIQKNLTIAIAESCTGGYVAKRITDIPGASKVFQCGVVTYSDEMKKIILGVSSEVLEKHGAISEQTALEMAHGVRLLGKADIGIGITGIAGPGGGTADKPVGLSFIALSDSSSRIVEKVEVLRKSDREYNRFYTASKALDMLRRYAQEFNESRKSENNNERRHN